MKKYSIDPARMEMEELERLIAGKNLLPGRILLKKDLHENFEKLEREGIGNLKQLMSALASPEKRKELAGQSSINDEWLILLKREAGSYLGRPFPLEKFPGIPFEYTEILRSRAVSSTRDFYECMQTTEDYLKWSRSTGIPEQRLKELHMLCDLSRINGVGPWFARILYSAGIRSSVELAASDPDFQLRLYEQARQEHYQDLPPLSAADMLHCINYAKVLCIYNVDD